MDLNEKIAARRRELAQEAERGKRAERLGVTAEAARGLTESEVVAMEATANAEALAEERAKTAYEAIHKDLDKAAEARLTSGEQSVTAILFIAGLLGFFVAWWIGLGLVVWSGVYRAVKVKKHKVDIIGTGKA